MERAKPLSFVKPFEPNAEDFANEERKKAAIETFSLVCQSLLAKHKAHIRTEEHYSDVGMITTFEVPLIVPFPDTSCIYAILFGQRRGSNVLNMGITVEECNTEQKILKGYTYGWDSSGLARTNNYTDHPDFDHAPFSMIQHLKDVQDLDRAYASDDPEDQAVAKAVLEEWHEREVISSFEDQLGYDGQTPDEGEVYQLADLLLGAVARVQE